MSLFSWMLPIVMLASVGFLMAFVLSSAHTLSMAARIVIVGSASLIALCGVIGGWINIAQLMGVSLITDPYFFFSLLAALLVFFMTFAAGWKVLSDGRRPNPKAPG